MNNKLLQSQLQEIYGKDFKIDTQDEKFQNLLRLIDQSYTHYEKEENVLEKRLKENAKQLKETNELLRKQQELLKSVENSIEDAIFYKDLQQRYIGCNKKFANFLGCSEAEIIGKTDYDLFDKNMALKYRKTNDMILKKRKKVVYKKWIEYQGEKIYVVISKTPLINNNGEVIGMVGISRDITHEYQLQKDVEHKNIMLIQQNKLVSMGEVIANIAHQWRQPLNILGLIIQKIGIAYKQNLLSPQEIDENIDEAMMIMQEMSETIDDFRTFFHPNRVLKDFDVHESILKSYTIIKPLIITHNITFKIKIDGKYSIHGYQNEFFQVMLNLLNNAIEALIADKIASPKITIVVSEKEEHIIINICDNANGIDKNIIEKIFNPYFTTKNSGTGLGLYMSKIIIEEHMKGKIDVHNSAFGTTFTLKLRKGCSH